MTFKNQNNNSNGRIVTASGNAGEFDAQASLTFSSSNNDPKLTITGSGHPQLNLTNTSGSDHTGINFGDSSDTNAGMIQYSNSNNKMQFHTNGSENMLIDSSGNVTKPNNFHLLVNLSQNYTVQNASTVTTDLVKWDRVITAQSSSGASSYFNTSTHLFTAPVDGIYLFHIAVNCDFNVEGAWLVIDGSRENYTAVAPPSQNTSSVSLTHKLTASQTVGVFWYDNGNTNGDFFSNSLHTWWKITLLG